MVKKINRKLKKYLSIIIPITVISIGIGVFTFFTRKQTGSN